MEDIDHACERMKAIPIRELAELNYGEGTCTTFDELVEEHEDADVEDKPDSTYSMLCDGAERIRARLMAAARAR